MKQTVKILTVTAVTLSLGCSKEPVAPTPVGNVAQPVIGARFDPPIDQTMPLILDFKRKKEAYALGAKSDPGEKPLQEAMWLAEALMNFEKGDASRSGDSWITGTVDYSFPIFLKADGSVWLYESDFYESYDAAMQQVNTAVGSGKIYSIDHEVLAVDNGSATLRIEWSDKDPTSSIGTPYLPSGSGCHDVDDGALILTSLLHWNFHQIAPEIPTFYVTLYPLEPPGAWATMYTNDPAEPNNYGIIGYLGTTVAQGGAGLLFNGNDFTNSICFPDQWNKLVIAREIITENINLESPYEFVRERVVWEGFTTGPIGIPLYPQGYYHHYFQFKVGRLMRL